MPCHIFMPPGSWRTVNDVPRLVVKLAIIVHIAPTLQHVHRRVLLMCCQYHGTMYSKMTITAQ